jgi:hypothetical protein
MSKKNTALSDAAMDESFKARDAVIDAYISVAHLCVDCPANDREALQSLLDACKTLAEAEFTVMDAIDQEDARNLIESAFPEGER